MKYSCDDLVGLNQQLSRDDMLHSMYGMFVEIIDNKCCVPKLELPSIQPSTKLRSDDEYNSLSSNFVATTNPSKMPKVGIDILTAATANPSKMPEFTIDIVSNDGMLGDEEDDENGSSTFILVASAPTILALFTCLWKKRKQMFSKHQVDDIVVNDPSQFEHVGINSTKINSAEQFEAMDPSQFEHIEP